MEKPGAAAAAARRRADDRSGIPPSTDAPQAPLCCGVRVTEGSHDGRKALAYFAVGTVLLLVVPDAAITWSMLGRPPAPQPWVSVALLGFACLGQLRSSTRPLLGLAVVTAAMAISPLLVGTTHTAVILVFCDLPYCAVLHSARRAGWWVAGAAGSVLVTIALVNLVHFGPQAAVGSFLGLMVIFAVPVFWAHEVRRHRDRADAEHARADQERRLAELGRLAAVADERNRMARELHDVIAGQLSAIAIQSEAALTIPDADEATLRRVLAEVRRGSVASLAEMRTMIGLLRTDAAEEAGRRLRGARAHHVRPRRPRGLRAGRRRGGVPAQVGGRACAARRGAGGGRRRRGAGPAGHPTGAGPAPGPDPHLHRTRPRGADPPRGRRPRLPGPRTVQRRDRRGPRREPVHREDPRGNVLAKLACRDRVQAVVFAYEHGVVEPGTG